MTIKIKGNLSPDNSFENSVSRTFTAEEATDLIKEGFRGMLSFIGSYQINGINYRASGISVGHDTFIFERDDKLVVPTYFKPQLLIGYEDSNEDRVFVDVIIDPTEAKHMHLTLVK